MSYSVYTTNGDGTTKSFGIPFDYINPTDISVRVGGVVTSFTFLTSNMIELATAPANGVEVEIRRVTPIDEPEVTFGGPGALNPELLNRNTKQNLYSIQEAHDDVVDYTAEYTSLYEATLAAQLAAQEAAALAEAIYNAHADEISALAGYRDFDTFTVLAANTTLSYSGTVPSLVTVGQFIRLRDSGIVYQVQAIGSASYHLATAGGVLLKQLPGIRGYNVKGFGAKGDDSTNDTAAITAAVVAGWTDRIPVYFPAATYRVNLNLTATHGTASSRIFWKGDGRHTTVLKSFDTAQDTIKWNIADYVTRVSFEGIQFNGNGSTTKRAWYSTAIHYSRFIDCQFTNAWVAHLMNPGFGITYDNCLFNGTKYDAGTGTVNGYGYVGIGTSGAYAGWNQFLNGCAFTGGKVSYFVDNLNAPAGEGNGNLHERSDFEAITGLSVFIRNQSGQPEQWRNTWFEGNATSGTVDVSDLPAPSNAIGTLTIPKSGTIIHSGTASSTTYKKTRLIVEGVFVGADCLGDVEIRADRLGGPVNKLSATPEAIVKCTARMFDPFQPTTEYAISEAVVDQLDYFNGVANAGAYSSYSVGAQGVHKDHIEYNPSNPNRILGANIDSNGVANGFVFSGAGTVALDNSRGGVLGRSYAITLNPGESVDIKGTGTSNSIVGYNSPTGVSFAIMHGTTGEIALDVENVTVGVSRGVFGSVKVRNEWKTYNILSFNQLWRPAIKNNTASAVTFYLTDLQGIAGLGGSGTRIQNHNLVIKHLCSGKLAGSLTTGVQIKPFVLPYIFDQKYVNLSVGAVTTEQVLATLTIPGGAVGPNGSVEVYTVWETNSNANNKYAMVRAGGAAGVQYMYFTLNSHVGLARNCMISNNNSQSSQTSDAPGGSTGIGSFTAGNVSSSVNTANNWDIVISGQKTNSADTLILKRYKVVINYGA